MARVTWTNELDQELLDLYEQYKDEPNFWHKIAEKMSVDVSYHGVRKRHSRIKNKPPPESEGYFYDKKQNRDGSLALTVQNIILQADEKLTDDEILELCNLDPLKFEIQKLTVNDYPTTIKNNDGEIEQARNFQFKLTVRPKLRTDLDPDKLADFINQIKPVNVDFDDEIVLTNRLLLIPLYDMHFGLNNLKDYQQLKQDIIKTIQNGYEEILIVLGGDYLHVDNMLNTTEFGTNIDQVDFESMEEEGFQFLHDLIHASLENSPDVNLTYLPGNHAPSNDYMLVKGIERLFPQVDCDSEIREYKHTWLGNHSIFLHHADVRKTTPKLLEVIVSEYAKEWGQATSRYLITGHLHHEKSLSNAGLTHYQVMSPSKPSSYDKKQGFTTSETGLMLFEFDDVKRRVVHYL